MLLNTEVLVEFEAFCIKQLTKCRSKITQEENPRIVHLKILSCFERIRTALNTKTGYEAGRNYETSSENVEN